MAHNLGRPPPSSLKDARAVKSSQAMRGALLALLERKALDQITVREIASQARVSYATFFRHHATKEALLDHVAADEIAQLVERTLPILDGADSYAAVVALCAYVADHRTLWTALLTGGAAATMRAELLRISRQVAAERAPKEGWLPVELATNYSAGLIFETLAWWLAQPPGGIAIERVALILDRILSAVERLEAD